MLKDDGRTIIWDLTDTEPYRTYTLNISMRLAADSAGNLPNGNFPTNDGDALLQKNESGIKINQVASPQLRRGGGNGGGRRQQYRIPHAPLRLQWRNTI